jgi:hypothetical protein
MPFTTAAWDGAAAESGQDAEAFCRCCLVDMNEGPKVKTLCKLPVRATPDGPVNLNAMAAAAAALAGGRGGLDAPGEAKRKAARKLIGLYREAEKDPPPALFRVAGMKVPARAGTSTGTG